MLPTPVFWSGEFRHSPRGRKESDTIEWLSLSWIYIIYLMMEITTTTRILALVFKLKCLLKNRNPFIHCWWECKLIHTFCRIIWQDLSKASKITTLSKWCLGLLRTQEAFSSPGFWGLSCNLCCPTLDVSHHGCLHSTPTSCWGFFPLYWLNG